MRFVTTSKSTKFCLPFADEFWQYFAYHLLMNFTNEMVVKMDFHLSLSTLSSIAAIIDIHWNEWTSFKHHITHNNINKKAILACTIRKTNCIATSFKRGYMLNWTARQDISLLLRHWTTNCKNVILSLCQMFSKGTSI